MNLNLEYCKNGHEMDKKDIFVWSDREEWLYVCYKCATEKILVKPKIRGQIIE